MLLAVLWQGFFMDIISLNTDAYRVLRTRSRRSRGD